MRAWWGRVGSMIALVAVALATVPRATDPAAHCRSDDRAAASHHHHDPADHPAPNNTGNAEQCPHCPPADCRRHGHCGAVTDSAVLEVAAAPCPAAAAAVMARDCPLPLARIFQPPTPPPQRLL